MLNNFMNMFIFNDRPPSCPVCGGTNFNWVGEEGGRDVWKCNSCDAEYTRSK